MSEAWIYDLYVSNALRGNDFELSQISNYIPCATRSCLECRFHILHMWPFSILSFTACIRGYDLDTCSSDSLGVSENKGIPSPNSNGTLVNINSSMQSFSRNCCLLDHHLLTCRNPFCCAILNSSCGGSSEMQLHYLPLSLVYNQR